MADPIIVCVDDDVEMLVVVGRCLRRAGGLDVRTTLNPTEALAWISNERVAVLVSDYEMPEMTGAQLAGHVKRLRPETVRILLTGLRTFETAVDGINQGEIFRFIAKPFEAATLLAAISDGVVRHEELVALSGDRQRRERREALHTALEDEYPGITRVEREPDGAYAVTEDPRLVAAELGFALPTLG